MNYECPSCKFDNIQKVSVAYLAGTSKTKGRGFGLGFGHGGLGIGFGFGKADNQTLLSGALIPPQPKHTFGIAFVIFVTLCVILFNANLNEFFVWSASFIIAGIYWMYASFADVKKINNYNESYICLRCGKIFILSETEIA
jgi:hypothetical protein